MVGSTSSKEGLNGIENLFQVLLDLSSRNFRLNSSNKAENSASFEANSNFFFNSLSITPSLSTSQDIYSCPPEKRDLALASK